MLSSFFLNRIFSGQTRGLTILLLAAALIEALVGLLLGRKQLGLRVIAAMLSILTAAAALMLPRFESDSDPLPTPETTPQLSDPRDTVEEFLAALLSGQYEKATGCLTSGTPIPPAPKPEGVEAQRVYEALTGSLACHTVGRSVIEGMSGRQSVSLTTLDLEALQSGIRAETEAYLRSLWDLRPRSALAAKDGSYLPEVAREAWAHAVDAVLSHREDFVRTEAVDLRLRCTDGTWQIENADDFFAVFGLAENTDFDSWAQRSFEAAQDGLVYARPVYTVAEDAARGPAYNESRFFHTRDPAEIQAVVDSAWMLLDGQDLCWSPETELLPGSEMFCYYDETILIICWKEVVDYCGLSFCEVKIADGSQLRRALTGGEYCSGPGPRVVQTQLSREVNAIVSINGDFYDYRKLGITVYQRQLYRNNPALVDSCFFTASGDMLFAHRGELSGEGEAERFIRDNDVVFGIAFGPILVEDGEATHTDSYPQGEVNGRYSRAAIGQLGECHYLLMTCGFESWYDNVPDINRTAQYIQAKGVDKAYTLDGGQTAQICVGGRTFNHIDFDTQRPLCDIIYFVTALPEEGA